MTAKPKIFEQRFDLAHQKLVTLITELSRVHLGQNSLVQDLVIALFAGGHVLLEGLPGLGKTHLAKVTAKALDINMARIQCTPDLMPSDITGSEVLSRTESGDFDFRYGPIFAHFILVDEINRTTPKTQSALLEAMQENQVTYMGRSYSLPRPFWVLATQNPIELEGTYPLPEAQLDRFLFKLKITTPEKSELLSILDLTIDEEPCQKAEKVLQRQDIETILEITKSVWIGDTVRQAAVDLILATHPNRPESSGPANQSIRYGSSPRGLQGLVRAARVSALIKGRAHVAIDDLAAVALPALRHRILLNMESEIKGIDVDDVLNEVIRLWRQSR